MEQISALAAIPDQKTKIEKYKALQQEYLSKKLVPQLKGLVEHLFGEDVPLVLSRQVLQDLASGLEKLSADDRKEIGLFVLEKCTPTKAASFEEQARCCTRRPGWCLCEAVGASLPLTRRTSAPRAGLAHP